MILIADSGGTKTDWALVDTRRSKVTRLHSQGISPVHQSEDEMYRILRFDLVPYLSSDAEKVKDIYFYGSGCTPDKVNLMQSVLQKAFPDATVIEVHGDLLAAARALFQRSSGVACILGTGANSCVYDGHDIVANTPPLGYILGDEGSGAVLGRNFVNALFKGFLPEQMKQDFLMHEQLTYPLIIQQVYREGMANRFLASFVPYIAEHIDNAQISQLVTDNFRAFFERNLSQYGAAGKVGFVGGVASQFAPQLRAVAQSLGYEVSDIQQGPIEGLVSYHSYHYPDRHED